MYNHNGNLKVGTHSLALSYMYQFTHSARLRIGVLTGAPFHIAKVRKGPEAHIVELALHQATGLLLAQLVSLCNLLC